MPTSTEDRVAAALEDHVTVRDAPERSSLNDVDAWMRVIEENVPVLVSTLRRAASRPVEAYPGWLVHDLAVHVLAVYQRTVAVLSTSAQTRPAPATIGRPPPAELPRELAAAAGEVLEAFSACTAPSVWTFGSDTSPRFWIRRMALETLLHTWDAEAAIGRERPIPEPVAEDAIDEFMDVYIRRHRGRQSFPRRSNVGLIARRPGTRRWWLELGPTGVHPAARPPSGAGDACLVADPGWMWLWLNRRVPRPPWRGDDRSVETLERALDGLRGPAPRATP